MRREHFFIFRSITGRNVVFFARYYQLTAIAVMITVAVIIGSLMIGDSVRTTLTKRVTERLGETETIIFSRNSFMEDTLTETPSLAGGSRGILLTNGFISRSGRLIPVFVWGVNDLSIPRGAARMNTALLNEMKTDRPDAIVLRLPASGLVPSGSLFVTENYTTSMRLSFDGTVDMENGGNLSMKNEQAIPLNIFVNREELAEVMNTEGKINLILTNKNIDRDDLEKIWHYSSSGLHVSPKEEFTEITSDRVFLQEEVVESIIRNNTDANRLFSYLANSIETVKPGMDAVIPYSFVTALDYYKGVPLRKNEIILSDYSAHRLNAKTGDNIVVTYYTSKDLKTLRTDSLYLQVKAILPLDELAADTLSADFPGLSDVERCTDWDSDLPIHMDLITDEDEKYWEHYRNTPKAIVAYEAVAGNWSNAYGSATAIRLPNNVLGAIAAPDLSDLRADMFGIQLIHPREAGVYAAKNGVDFAGLFLALGFFIIVAAILLMLVPLSEMLHHRKAEIDLLKALGYTPKRITRMLWKESAPVVFVSSAMGIIAGFLYTVFIMWLLGNVWKGATHTDGFAVYSNIITIMIGVLVGFGLSLCVLRIVIVKSLKEKKTNLKKKKTSLKRKKTLLIFLSILMPAIIGVNFLFLQTVTLFVVVGIILLGTAAIWGDYLIDRNGGSHTAASSGLFSTEKMIWSTLYMHKKQAGLSFFALATGVFIIFSVGLNRKGFADSSQIRAGTGGYTLWCESTVPVYHNMATAAGREKLSLTSLPANTEVLQCLRLSADDASCLNLNKVSTPTVLGVDMNALSESDFQITQHIYSLNGNDVFQQIQTCTDTVYAALIDATVLTWSLGMRLGDTLYYESDRGQRVAIRLAGTLPNTIFQGNILIDRSLFAEIWEETTGSEVFLLKTNETEKESVKTLLSQALSEYGVRVTTTNDRLRQFNTVTDTYLTIFLTLGCLGLLLGIMSFIIVIRKNLFVRRREMALYKMVGFTDDKIEQILYRENLLVPLYALATGVISSLVGVSVSFMNAGIGVWLVALFFTVFLVVCLLVFVRRSVKNSVCHKIHPFVFIILFFVLISH